MGKKKQRDLDAGIMRALKTITVGLCMAFALYRVVMSVLKHIVVYEGFFQDMQGILGGAAIISGAVYLLLMPVLSPGKGRGKGEKRRSPLLAPETLLLAGMVIWALLSCWSAAGAMPGYDLWGLNKALLYDFAAQAVLLYPLGMLLASKRGWRPLRIVLTAIVLTAAVCGAFILYRVSADSPIFLSDGGIGISQGGVLVINSNRNTTGMWGVLLFYAAFSLLVTARGWWKLPLAAALPVFYSITFMTGSRTSMYGLCAFAGAAALLLVVLQKKISLPRAWMRWALGALAGMAAAALAFSLRNVPNLLFMPVRAASGTAEAASAAAAAATSGAAAAAPTVDLSLGLSNRDKLWAAALRLMVSDVRTFFFGVSPARIFFTLWPEEMLYAHNQFLEMGAGCGVPSMLMFIAFTAFIVRDCFRVCFREKSARFREALIPLGLFLLYLTNLTESSLFYYNMLSGELFVLLAGWLVGRARSLNVSQS